jgi:hypothetical protein
MKLLSATCCSVSIALTLSLSTPLCARVVDVDVPNRGRPISHFIYNSARENFLPLELNARTGFLQHQGFPVGMVQWELGQGIAIPSFTDERGAKQFVEGVGSAANRDFGDFMRTLPTAVIASSAELSQFAASKNRPNRLIAVGYSQTARLLKTLLIGKCLDKTWTAIY